MPQLDFSWWATHLIINWTLWATIYLSLSTWYNSQALTSKNSTQN
uniref:ATP synthase F0 subunit 8 n=1 Tax=Amphioplus laevis TaxID=2806440 RepID=A0A888URR7_9ECHI|nr:ATP synthase F0 subunit 8 [Amphioplus laevis]QRC36794.1 ATP synthase F0 subunit 8 [Amphioplus laevis]